MKRKILLFAVMSLFITAFLFAQKSKKSSSNKQITGYAITAPEKGQMGWMEVRLVDIATGAELKTVYKDKQET